jgi:hypothetical protein
MSLPKPGFLSRLFLVFFVSAVLEAGENGDLRLADLHYDRDDYGRARELYEHSLLREDLSGDTLYRYGYSYEQTRGLDSTALKIYALSRYYNGREGRSATKYGQYAAAKLEAVLADDPPGDLDEGAAAALLEDLRDSIRRERKTRFYRWVDRIYPLISRFSLFRWKLIASLAMFIPFLAGVLILGLRGRGNRP